MATVDSTAPIASRPPRMSANPLRRVADDLLAEWRGRGSYPPGPGDFSVSRTRQMAHDPLPLLLAAYEEFGPIFSMRLLHTKVVFMLGPEANQYITVGHPENFHWRESSFGDLIPLLGDGLLTIDDSYHDRARAIMLPAFHREQVDAATAAMVTEADAALAALAPDTVVDVYAWMRRLAMRDRDAGRCSASTPTTAARAPSPPRTSSRRSASSASTSRCGWRVGRARPGVG